MRTMIKPLALALLIPFSVAVHRALAADAPPDAKPRLRWSLVAGADDKAGVVEVDDANAPGGKLRVFKDAFLDETGIESAEVTTVDGKTAVSLKMTKDGAARLGRVTSDNLNRRVAVLFDGRVVFAPVIRSRISDAAMITGGEKGLDEKDAKAIADAIRTARAEDAKPKQPAPPAK
jgi:preprotein translocase subunit SecD